MLFSALLFAFHFHCFMGQLMKTLCRLLTILTCATGVMLTLAVSDQASAQRVRTSPTPTYHPPAGPTYSPSQTQPLPQTQPLQQAVPETRVQTVDFCRSYPSDPSCVRREPQNVCQCWRQSNTNYWDPGAGQWRTQRGYVQDGYSPDCCGSPYR